MEQLLTFLAVVVGALASVLTTLVVERQRTKTESQQRAEERRQQSRSEFHQLLVDLQTSMNRTVEIANDIAYHAGAVADADVRDAKLDELDVNVRRAVLLTELLAARLPSENGRQAVGLFLNEVQEVRGHAVADPDGATDAANRAFDKYTDAVDMLALPLRSFYEEGTGLVRSTRVRG